MRRVLIIDDEDDIREVAAMSLESTVGWQVLKASSAEAGLAIAGRENPDAILMDLKMPVIDGHAALRMLQANPLTSRIPVLLLTAKVKGVQDRGFNGLGAAGVLLKPFDPFTLGQQIADALGWKA